MALFEFDIISWILSHYYLRHSCTSGVSSIYSGLHTVHALQPEKYFKLHYLTTGNYKHSMRIIWNWELNKKNSFVLWVWKYSFFSIVLWTGEQEGDEKINFENIIVDNLSKSPNTQLY